MSLAQTMAQVILEKQGFGRKVQLWPGVEIKPEK